MSGAFGSEKLRQTHLNLVHRTRSRLQGLTKPKTWVLSQEDVWHLLKVYTKMSGKELLAINRLFSFIGTGRCLPCRYFKGEHVAQETPVVQLALLELLQKEGHEIHEVVVFATDIAREKNGELLINEFQEKEVKTPYKLIPVVGSVTGDNIWDLFETVYNEIQTGDTIYFDITHGFRSFPLAVLPMLHYSRELKKIDVGGIYYGNLEAGSTIEGVIHAPLDELTDVLSFLEWTYGINTFLKTGSAEVISRLVNEEKKKNPLVSNCNTKVANSMQKFNRALETCRGISFQENAEELKAIVREAAQDTTGYHKLLKNLFNELDEKMAVFTSDKVMDPFYAVKWCIDHGLTQQAYTLLNEHVITALCLLLNENCEDKNTRQIVSRAIHIISNKDTRDSYEPSSEREGEIIKRTRALLGPHPEVISCLNTLKTYRNDLNHAEHVDSPAPSQRFEIKIREIVVTLEPYFRYIQSTQKA